MAALKHFNILAAILIVAFCTILSQRVDAADVENGPFRDNDRGQLYQGDPSRLRGRANSEESSNNYPPPHQNVPASVVIGPSERAAMDPAFQEQLMRYATNLRASMARNRPGGYAGARIVPLTREQEMARARLQQVANSMTGVLDTSGQHVRMAPSTQQVVRVSPWGEQVIVSGRQLGGLRSAAAKQRIREEAERNRPRILLTSRPRVVHNFLKGESSRQTEPRTDQVRLFGQSLTQPSSDAGRQAAQTESGARSHAAGKDAGGSDLGRDLSLKPPSPSDADKDPKGKKQRTDEGPSKAWLSL